MGPDSKAGAFREQVGPAHGDLAQRCGRFLLFSAGDWPATGEAACHAGDLSEQGPVPFRRRHGNHVRRCIR
jgi:hypothetical protein